MKTRVKKRFSDFKRHVKDIVHQNKDESINEPKYIAPASAYNDFELNKPLPEPKVIVAPAPINKPFSENKSKQKSADSKFTKPQPVRMRRSVEAMGQEMFPSLFERDESFASSRANARDSVEDFSTQNNEEEELQLAMALSLSMMANDSPTLNATELAYFRQLYDEIELNKMATPAKTTSHQNNNHSNGSNGSNGSNEEKIEKAKFAVETPEDFTDTITYTIMDRPVRLVVDGKPSQHAMDKTTADKILQEPSPTDPFTKIPVSHYIEDDQLRNRITAWVNKVTSPAGAMPTVKENSAKGLRQYGLYSNNKPAGSEPVDLESLVYYQYK